MTAGQIARIRMFAKAPWLRKDPTVFNQRPDSMPPKNGNPAALAKLALDPECGFERHGVSDEVVE